jgi:uncharacterized RDD family membrane protein YckC
LTPHVEPDRDVGLQGHYAGIVTRGVAFVIDVFVIVLAYDLFVRGMEFLVSTISGDQWRISNLPVASWLLLVTWGVLYCTYPVAAGGRTFGMAVTGLRVVRFDGTSAGTSEAVVRLLALPLSFLTLGIGFLLILLRQDRRALQDLIGKTAVVYGWDARTARLRFLAEREPEEIAGPAPN